MDLNITFSVVSYQQFGLDINVATKVVNMSNVNNNNPKIINMTPPVWRPNYKYNSHRPNPLEKSQLVSYVDFVFQVLGIDLNFEKWCEMTENERTTLIREIKLQKIIKDE